METTERRRARRFAMHWNVEYEIGGEKERGAGKVIEMSRTGIRFTSDGPLQPGIRLRLFIDWPVKLNNTVALNFVADARVIRCQDNEVAAEILHHDFRTRSNRRIDTTPTTQQHERG
jgi:hypothetical protein